MNLKKWMTKKIDRYYLVATFNSDDPMRYLELTETLEMPYDRILSRVKRYYTRGYQDYGPAEAVELEMRND